MFLTREIPSVFGEPLAPKAIKCCSLCVEETQTQKCTACRIANTTHRKDTLIRRLNSNSGIKLSKKLQRKVAHFGARGCCGLLQTWHKYYRAARGAPEQCVPSLQIYRASKMRSSLVAFYLRVPGAVAGHCVYAACLLSCADCQHTKSIRACKCGSQRGQMLDECAIVCDSANCFKKE